MSDWKKYECIVCGWVYDEELGEPELGIAPFTRWADMPDDFICPMCAVNMELFEEVHVS